MPPSKRGTADAAKLRAEIALRRAQAELEHLHLEIERGLWASAAHFEAELVGRAVGLEAGYDHSIYSRLTELLAVAGSDPEHGVRTIAALQDLRDDWFQAIAESGEFDGDGRPVAGSESR